MGTFKESNSPSAFPANFSNTNALQQKRYRFIYNRSLIWQQAVISVVLLIPILITMGIIFNSTDKYVSYWFIIFAIFLPLVTVTIVLFSRFRQVIEIDQQGIHCPGFLNLNGLPKLFAWDELALIRLVSFKLLSKQANYAMLFMPRIGSERILSIEQDQKELYQGKDHSLTLQEAIEAFYGPIQTISDEERRKFNSLRFTADLGKELGHVAYCAVFLLLIAIAANYLVPLHPLDSRTHTPIYWGAGITALLISGWYMRHAKNKITAIIPALLISGVAAFAMMPLMAAAPLLTGHTTQEVFAIKSQSEGQQIWSTPHTPALTFTSYGAPKRWCYQQGSGTTRELTVYHGPMGLSAILKADYKSFLVSHGSCQDMQITDTQ